MWEFLPDSVPRAELAAHDRHSKLGEGGMGAVPSAGINVVPPPRGVSDGVNQVE